MAKKESKSTAGNLNLTPSQEKAWVSLKRFVDIQAKDTFILNGYAGTGKTFLIKKLIEYIRSKEIDCELLATTGRAAAVLKDRSGFSAKTVHSSVYKFSELSGAADIEKNQANHHGQLMLDFAICASPESTKIVIVDEASLMSNMASEQDQAVKFGSGKLLTDFLQVFNRSKVILVGDPAQLPPIASNGLSPALSKTELQSLNRSVDVASLTEVMRTDSTNDILSVASDLRKYIVDGVAEDTLIPYLPDSPWIKILAKNRNCITVVPNVELLLASYLKKFLEQKGKNLIAIAKSNNEIIFYNTSFRKLLYKDQVNQLHVGEPLMVTQNNTITGLSNGEFVEVVHVGESHMHCGLSFTNITIKESAHEMKIETVISSDALFGRGNIVKDQIQLLMKDFIIRMSRSGIKPNTIAFNDAMIKDRYLNALKCTFGYFVTCHKTQGGEWDQVFIFAQKAMLPIPQHIEPIKWWYTALTRAKKHVYTNDGYWIR